MPDGIDLIGELFDAMKNSRKRLDAMAGLGEQWARAEREYRVAKARQILVERAEHNTPVSIIADIVKGDGRIANLAYERDCAKTNYEANKEAVMFWKKKIDVLRELNEREWSR